MSNVKARPVQVDVYADMEGESIRFDQTWRVEGNPDTHKGHIDIAKGEADVPIKFHLHDSTGLNLSFLPSGGSKEDSPFWCSATACPTSWGDGDGQIKDVQSSNNLLKVVDANSGEPCTLHYALRFTGNATASGPPYAYDPDIRNGGGGVGGGGGA